MPNSEQTCENPDRVTIAGHRLTLDQAVLVIAIAARALTVWRSGGLPMDDETEGGDIPYADRHRRTIDALAPDDA